MLKSVVRVTFRAKEHRINIYFVSFEGELDELQKTSTDFLMGDILRTYINDAKILPMI